MVTRLEEKQGGFYVARIRDFKIMVIPEGDRYNWHIRFPPGHEYSQEQEANAQDAYAVALSRLLEELEAVRKIVLDEAIRNAVTQPSGS